MGIEVVEGPIKPKGKYRILKKKYKRINKWPTIGSRVMRHLLKQTYYTFTQAEALLSIRDNGFEFRGRYGSLGA